MIRRSTLETAAFWHQWVCLECGSPLEAPDETPDEGEELTCSECTSHKIINAETALRVVEALQEDDE